MTKSFSEYIHVRFDEIEQRLAELLTPASSDQGLIYSASSSQNIIVLCSQAAESEQVERLLRALSEMLPGRCFLVQESPESDAVRASITARCRLLADGEHLCSEIIRLEANADQLDVAESVVLAHRLSGQSTILFLADGGVRSQAILQFSPLVDEILFDSREFLDRPGLLRELTALPLLLIDLAWLATGVWRQEIVRLLNRPEAGRWASEIEAIEIEFSNPREAEPDSVSLLIACWLLVRLSCRVAAVSSLGYECAREDGRTILLSLRPARRSEGFGPASVRLRLTSGLTLLWERDAGCLVGSVEEHGDTKFSCGYSELSKDELIERHFFVGESLERYPAAMELLLELHSLHEGFSAGYPKAPDFPTESQSH